MMLLERSPVPYRAKGFSPKPAPWGAVFSFVGVIAIWQVGSSYGWISELAMPSPFAIGAALYELMVTGMLWLHLGASLQRLVIGWIFGTAGGVLIGILVGLFTWARSSGIAFVAAIFPIPKIALLPLFIIWFGIGEASKVATIAFGVFFSTAISIYGGIDNVPRNLIRMGQSFNLTQMSIIKKILVPGAMAAALSGFRISLSIAIILLVAAEMIGAEYGIGAFILAQGNLYQMDRMLAGVVVLSSLGLTFSAIITIAEKVVLRWR